VTKTIAGMTTCYYSMLTATMKSTANGIYGKDPDTEEPDEAKVCAVSRTERIATRGGRSSGQMTPR
jgi:co-chaperonin GroES (HSP10)